MFSFLKRYKGYLALLAFFSLGANGLSLAVPKLVSNYIDAFDKNGSVNFLHVCLIIGSVSVVVLVATFLQYVVSAYASEKIAYDLRNSLIKKLSTQNFAYISKVTLSRLITNFTSDVDGIRDLVAQGIVGMFSAVLTFVGVIILMLMINVRLALYTFTILPLLILTFVLVFGKLMRLFKMRQENLDFINKVINESVIASTLVRVLNAERTENEKFDVANKQSRSIGLTMLYYFSALIPVVTLLANFTTVIILWIGGNRVIGGTLTLGDLNAFFAYSAMFIWPVFVLSFSGSMFSQAKISFTRLEEVLLAENEDEKIDKTKLHSATLVGKIEFKNVSLVIDKRNILKDVSFTIRPHTRNAILGPTAAGKTQLLYLITGLIKPTSGQILIDDTPVDEWNHSSLLSQLGLVFQDSVVFSSSLRENIQFKEGIPDEQAERAIRTSELSDLVESLPKGLNTLMNERGTNLSGGQKQRLMLARALAMAPKVLLLDDFTARVDISTEQKIISNIATGYPDITLISITQKVDPIKDYEQVIVLIEGELVDSGTHDELLSRSVEYKQIYESQQKAHE